MSAKWTPIRVLGGTAAFAASAYAAYVAVTWFRYGRAPAPVGYEVDPWLDQFMPQYDVVERHGVRVSAPAELTLSAACGMDVEDSRIVRTIFRGRELILRSKSGDRALPQGLLAATQAMGWGTLVESPGREIVMGAVVQPWKPNPVFQALPPENFKDFHEPEYVKIVWTLRADPVDSTESIFRSETRAVATCPVARRKFRAYWSFLSPGIILIRYAMLRQVKAEAESRAGGSSRPLTELSCH